MENVNAQTIKDFVLIGLALLGAVGMVVNLVRKPNMAITPDPLRIEKLDKFATRDFCQTIHTEVTRRLDGHDHDIKALYGELKDDRLKSEIHASSRSSAIYKKIDDLRIELTDKIDSMPDRVIETLNSLGKLR